MGKKLINASKQAYDLKEKHNDCLGCGEAIYNPICPNCIALEFNQWILQHQEFQKEVLIIIKNFLKNHKNFSESSSECIICGHNSAYLCPYCFTEFLFELLKSLKIDKKSLGEFLEMFNYDFEHTGYYKEGESLGAF